MKAEGNRRCWSAATNRFVACMDADGQPHDYGFTLLNLEAAAYRCLPRDWPKLTIDRIRFHGLVLRIRALRDQIEITKEAETDEPLRVTLGQARWKLSLVNADGSRVPADKPEISGAETT